MALTSPQELPGMVLAPAFLVVEDDYPGIGLQDVAPVSPLIASYFYWCGEELLDWYYDVA
jgi:hypothetical protein